MTISILDALIIANATLDLGEIIKEKLESWDKKSISRSELEELLELPILDLPSNVSDVKNE